MEAQRIRHAAQIMRSDMNRRFVVPHNPEVIGSGPASAIIKRRISIRNPALFRLLISFLTSPAVCLIVRLIQQGQNGIAIAKV